MQDFSCAKFCSSSSLTPIDLGGRFLRRRFNGYLDPFLAADLFRPFVEDLS